MSSEVLGGQGANYDVFRDPRFDVQDNIHFAALVLKNTLTEYGLTDKEDVAIAADDFSRETVLYILGAGEASYEKFDKALTTFLSSTNDNTPRFIIDLAYLCQEIVERCLDGIDFQEELLRVLAEHNLYGMPPKEA